VTYPHGMCSLFNQSLIVSQHAALVNGAQSVGCPENLYADPAECRRKIQNEGAPPVMCYYEPAKSVTSGANIIANQQRDFATAVSQAAVIVIIGTQVAPQDTHIWDPIAKASAKVVFCGGSQGTQGYRAWQQQHRQSKAEVDVVLAGYWDAEFETIQQHAKGKPVSNAPCMHLSLHGSNFDCRPCKHRSVEDFRIGVDSLPDLCP